MSWFHPVAPSADLGDLLDCRYVAASAGQHDLLPDGCMDLVWSDELGVVLCGPDTRGWSFELPPGRRIAGVRFRPGAAADVLGVPARELVDRRLPLADVLGARTARELDERLADASSAGTRMAVFEDLVRSRRREATDATVAIAAVVAAEPGTSVDSLADRAGVSVRQLRRRFDRAVGYGPAFLSRVARLQRFATGAVRAPGLGLAELAAASGYADQSHLAKDARAIAGRTPTELLGVLARSSLAVDVRPVHDRAAPPPRRRAA